METKEQFLARYNAAKEAGATEAELQAMITERAAAIREYKKAQEDSKRQQAEADRLERREAYLQKKKEEEEAAESASALAPTSDVDFGGPGSGLATPATPSESAPPINFDPSLTYELGGKKMQGDVAQAAYDYSRAYSEERKSYLQNNFDLEAYYKNQGMDAEVARIAEMSPEQKELERQSYIDAIDNMYRTGDERANTQAFFGVNVGSEWEAAAKEQRDRYDELLNVPAEQLFDSRAGVEQMTGFNTNNFLDEVEDTDLTDEQKARKYKNDLLDYLEQQDEESAKSALNGEYKTAASKRVKETLPGYLSTNPERLREVEQELFRNHDIAVDLTGEGYINESGSYFTRVNDIFLPGISKAGYSLYDATMSWLVDPVIRVATLNDERVDQNSQERAAKLDELKDNIAVSQKDLTSKIYSGELLGAFADGLAMMGESSPMIAGALIAGRVGGPRAAFATVSYMGAASVYSDARTQEWFQNLSIPEKFGYIVPSGIAEGLPAMVGANIATRTFASVRQAIAQIGKDGFGKMAAGVVGSAALGGIEEAVTEGVTAGWQYTEMIEAKQQAGEAVRWNYDDFSKQVVTGAYAGLAMGVTMSGLGSAAASMALKFSDVLKSDMVITELRKQYDEAESVREKEAIGAKIVDAVQARTKSWGKRQQLFEYLGETNPELFDRLLSTHAKIVKLSAEYAGAKGARRAEITKEMRQALEERANIEKEADASLDTDIDLELKLLRQSAKRVGGRADRFGGLFADTENKVTVTADNLSEYIERLVGVTAEDAMPLSRFLDKKFAGRTTGERIAKGINNVASVVKAMSSLGDFQVDMYRTIDSFIDDMVEEVKVTDEQTGEQRNITREEAMKMAGRGMWMGEGQIKLVLPLLSETTSYHEAYHDFVLQTLGNKAAIQLAERVFKALPKNLVEKYSMFLAEYGGADVENNPYVKPLSNGKGQVRTLTDILGDKSISSEARMAVADEFLMEFLADLTEGNIDIEFQKGVISQFMDWIRPTLGRVGIDVKYMPNAKTADVVSALQKLTSQMREGKQLTAQQELKAAVVKANYGSIALRAGIVLDDQSEDGFDETKPQMVFRAGNLTDKAEPAARMNSGRSTGHFGTGFYFFSDEQRAVEYARGEREVSQLNIADYNLARATKGLHDVLKDINNTREARDGMSGADYRFNSYDFVRVGSVTGDTVTEEQSVTMRDKAQAMYDKQKALPVEQFRGKDSISTIVMKAMGYEGVNAVGTDLDNSTYGTVIYDIKKGAEPKAQAVQGKGGKIFATVVFKVSLSGKANWPVKKEFENQAHLDNYIRYMEKNRGWRFDELYVHEGEYDSEKSNRNASRQKSDPLRETRDARFLDIIDASDAQGINYFARSMDRAMKMMAERGINIGLQVTQLSEADVQKIVDEGGTIFMTSDYGAGGYITSEGYVGGIFKNPDTVFKRITKPMFAAMEKWAQERGVDIFFDAFATELEDIYIGLGYKPVARTSFDREFAPEGWDAENSPLLNEPDVVFFVKGEGAKGDGVRFDDYMQAYDEVKSKVRKPKAQALPNADLEQNAEVPFQQAANITEEDMAARRAEIKLPESQRQKRNSTILQVLNKYELGEITQQDYLRAVRENMPIKPFDVVPEIPSVIDVAASLTSDKVAKGIIGVNKELEDGYYVGLRLDIPAYDTYDTWVVSVHQGKRAEERTPFLGGRAVGYGQTAVITNATFDSTPLAALNIARGKGKQTIARMFGDWKNESPESVYQRAVEIMEGPEYNSDYKEIGKMEGWVQVGMNPFRHSWFYDKRDGRPLAEASEIIQVGALVLAKDAVKVSEADDRFNAKSSVSKKTIKFQRPGSTEVDPQQLVKPQTEGKFTFEYTASTETMKGWLKDGTVRVEEIESFTGKPVLSHSPDNMMVGKVSVGGRTVVEPGGGLFHAANSGDVWAVAGENAGNSMVKELNALREEAPDGKAYLLLVSGHRLKLRSSTNGIISFASLGFELVREGVLTKNALNNAIKNVLRETEEASIKAQRKENAKRKKEGKPPKEIKKGTAGLSSYSGSLDTIFDRFVIQFASPAQSTFEQRREFMVKFKAAIKAEVIEAINSGRVSEDLVKDKYEKIFGARPSASQWGSMLENFFADNFTEKLLQGVPVNQVYAAIEVDRDVELVRSEDPTDPYPLKIAFADGSRNPRTIVFNKMAHALQVLETRSRTNPYADRMLIGDAVFDENGDPVMVENKQGEMVEKFLTEKGFMMKGGMGQATWGRMYVRGEIPVESISNLVVDLDESRPVGVQAKAQGSLIQLLADMIDPDMPTPSARVTKRGKLIIAPSKTELWNKRKKEVVDLLVASGMTKEAALDLYANAKAYKEGRTAGRKTAEKNARNTVGKRARKLQAESKRLRDDLNKLKKKGQTVDEFLALAIKMIDERMKELGTVPFSNKDVQRLVKIARQAHRASANRIEKEGGAEVMDTFVEKIIDIFDKKDAQKAMREYLASVSAARKLQSRLKALAKKRKKGEALKSTASYHKVMRRLAAINPALLSPSDIGGFINTLNSTVASVSKVKTKFDAEEQRIVAESPSRQTVATLDALANKYVSLEEMGRQAVMVAKAKAAAEKNGTDFASEYDKLVKQFERRRLSATRKAILDFIEANPGMDLDPANPADVEFVLEKIAENKADLENQSKEAIVRDVLLPRIAANLDKLLEDQHIAEILGIYEASGFDANALVGRLDRLDKVVLANLEYKLDDYIMNDSVMGLGYLAARVRGKLEMADRIESDLLSKGIGADTMPWAPIFDSVDSFIRLIFPYKNKVISEIRSRIGFAAMERAFAKADMIHAMTTEAIVEERDRIEGEGGSLQTVFDNAVMQLYSMARQMPVLEEGAPGQNAAEWYLNLRDAMRRSIDHYSEQKELYDPEEIQEMEDAFEFLFSEGDLDSLKAKVEGQRPDLVEFVDFMVGMHRTFQDTFANYVERYLGKNLVTEGMYTPFQVKTKVRNEAVDEQLAMRQAIMDNMRSASLANAKKVAGSSFERNPKSISGGNNIIGLNFMKINERTLRENTILSNTVGDVMALQTVFSSEAMAKLIKDDGQRHFLHTKLMQYITQDAGQAPAAFQRKVKLFGKKRYNPLNSIRVAAIVKAFGSVAVQTLKQSTVMISAMSGMERPVQSIPYMMKTFGEFFAFAVRQGVFKDSKMLLDANGRYKLLQNSPVFSRDYEAGSIDPYTGSIDTETSWFLRTQDKLSSISLQNLKWTDKIVAISSWFAFYGDYLLSEGIIDDINSIDWEAEASSPNLDALSYADSMVTKDQAASTPRQAADVYKDDKGNSAAMVSFVRNVILPYARHTINKKRSIYSDGVKIARGDSDTKREGYRLMAGHMAELTAFHSISAFLLAGIASLIVGDDEEEPVGKDNKLLNIGASVIVDMLPIPPVGYSDAMLKELANYTLLFKLPQFLGVDDLQVAEGETDAELFERAKRTRPMIRTYYTQGDLSLRSAMGTVLGPYGQFINDVANIVQNLDMTDNKYISTTGKTYYVRPEDKQQLDIHHAMRFALMLSQIAGFSSKEIDLIVRRMDDLPRERSFKSEEELAAYELVASAFRQEDNIADLLADENGAERLMKLLQEKMDMSPYDAARVVNRFKTGLRAAAAEEAMRQLPGYSKYIRTIRNIDKSAKDAKDFYIIINRMKDEMSSEEFAEFKYLADSYMAMLRQGALQESYYYNLTE